MTQPPDDFDPPVGQPVTLSPGLRRIVAPNPSPMTYRGTNTYLVGDRDLAVIDPGPMAGAHLEAILSAVTPGQRISHVIVTHTHTDHSPLARPLAERSGTPVLAFGDAVAGRSAVMADLAAGGMTGGGEGIDTGFLPDRRLADGDRIETGDWALEVIHTPGHIGNHIALAWGEICFVGDHVMGWASSLVSPPDGDLTDFMASCRRLRGRDWSVFHAGHGAPITDPAGRLDWLIGHRLSRERSILNGLGEGPATTGQLTRRIYTDTPEPLLPAASRNVFAHLVDLTVRERVEPLGALSPEVRFGLRR
ncbi:MBL fold metallo-hydrolase [Pukyongiella litopenaei]|uniref:MBL fold metallo-hydrolase n=1 Tax=Pukyongiella litopenaei TaxID=2605946 RepID=A0A2S0ML43_9RHOB|nr:MBL fold metallo-hydrolase [Pukyongiella litopenaei]AVO36547.1 MBL fold metallo-hydrolase [Pukyongiella litopenaei]